MQVLTAALAFCEAGVAVVPAATNGTKAPAGAWRVWQHRRADHDQIRTWLDNDYPGFGLVCGAVSGNLEMVELEAAAVLDGALQQLGDLAAASGLMDLWQTIIGGYAEASPTGGAHFLYRVDGPIAGNTKLARRVKALGPDDDPNDKIEVLAETRGEGGFVIVAPSNGLTHPTGKPWVLLAGGPNTIPVITAEQRDAVHTLFRTLDRMPAPQPSGQSYTQPSHGSVSGRLSPGDEYASRTDWAEILEPHGWIKVCTQGNTIFWRRPGKPANEQIGWSARTGYGDGGDWLWIWSTSTVFEAEKTYTKFGAYTVLNHSGDFKAAARALRPLTAVPERSFTAEPVTVAVEVPIDGLDTFWDDTPWLIHIHQVARARSVGPWALLGCVIARVIAHTQPSLVLSPVVGSKASLNLIVGLVGPPAAGKDTAIDTAEEMLPNEDISVPSPGSGEGIRYCFAHMEKNLTVMDRDRAIMRVSEVDTLTAISDRKGSTVMPELRKLWSGQELGASVADPTRRVRVKAHTYRGCLIVGIQPVRATAILNDRDGGMPQRLLWLPAEDSDAPIEPPPQPDLIPWSLPRFTGTHLSQPGGWFYLGAPERAVREIREARHAGLTGQETNLDGHRLLTQRKVAAGLAILHGRWDVLEDDWRRAEIIMAVSDRTRALVLAAIAAEAKKVNLARGRSEGERVEVVAETVDDARTGKVAARVLGQLSRNEWTREGVLRQRCRHDQRYLLADALIRLTDARLVESETFEYRGQEGLRYRKC
jgi:hypothetical protein